MSRAFIALGSNLDAPAEQLQRAVSAIAMMTQTSIRALSSVYRSKAVGPGDQADYFNAVIEVKTDLSPQALLEKLQAQEDAQGRVRTVRWGARTLDLDILLYDDHQIATETLTVPHPEMTRRSFVLYPLVEITGEKMVLPCGENIDKLLARCPRGELELTTESLTIHERIGS